MISPAQQSLLQQIPAITDLLKTERVEAWLADQPRPLVTECLRRAVQDLRQSVLNDTAGRCGPQHVGPKAVLDRAAAHLEQATQPHIREAINATGIILHTGLGRAVLPERVIDSILPELKGYVNLAIDRDSGERIERDELVEYLLTELTGAEAATVVNNNCGATLLALAALAARHEVIVSRGQLIEIGGSFRLPDVMAQSQAQMVEVGTTNRTHLKDYRAAFTENTAAILRVHPSNYRVIGFTHEAALADLVELAHSRGVLLLDDLGAGALVDLKLFGRPHEPTVQESIAAGADLVWFSADKLIGAGQGGILVGRRELIEKVRQHPLMRALRVDKTCILVLERTLQLFRDPERLRREHPTYRMLSTPLETLEARARALAEAIRRLAPRATAEVVEAQAYMGSGSLPTEALPSRAVRVSLPGVHPSALAKQLRLDRACVFGRIENDQFLLDVRTLTDAQVAAVAEALGRAAAA